MKILIESHIPFIGGALDDLGEVVPKFDGLERTVPDTFITALAALCIQFDDVAHCADPPALTLG